MSTPAGGPGSEVGPVCGSTYDDQLLVRNGEDTPAHLTVVQRTGDHVTSDTIEADTDSTYGVAFLGSTGTTLVEVHTPDTMATVSIPPDDRPPLFTYRDGAVLVDR